jgi:hypothetical protein
VNERECVVEFAPPDLDVRQVAERLTDRVASSGRVALFDDLVGQLFGTVEILVFDRLLAK